MTDVVVGDAAVSNGRAFGDFCVARRAGARERSVRVRGRTRRVANDRV